MTSEEYKSYLKKNYPHTSTFVTGLLAFIVDIIVIMLCLCLGFFIVNLISSHDIEFRSFMNYIVFVPVMVIIFALLGLYPGIMISPAEEVRKYATGTFFSFALLFFLQFFLILKTGILFTPLYLTLGIFHCFLHLSLLLFFHYSFFQDLEIYHGRLLQNTNGMVFLL